VSVVPFVVWTFVALGQSGQAARPLLRGVADASRNLTTYRAEGHIALDMDIGLRVKEDLRFRVALRSPRFMRLEVTGGPEWATGLPP
jgi:hypothetical protein